MSTIIKPLEELIHGLSPRLRDEVRRFVEFLLSKQTRSKPRRLRQDWAGTLKAEGQTGVSLQHLASEASNAQSSAERKVIGEQGTLFLLHQ